MRIAVPGLGELELETLVLDYNGTVAEDGELLPGVAERILDLSSSMEIVVLTADTHGTCRARLDGLPVRVEVIGPGREDSAKRRFVETIGATSCVAVGNGRNDGPMLQTAHIGIAVIQAEGASPVSLNAADVVVTDIRDALDLLLKPSRLTATLRT